MRTRPRFRLCCKKCKRRSADIRKDSKAWNSWQVTPFDVCPLCIQADMAARGFQVTTSQAAGKVMHSIGLTG